MTAVGQPIYRVGISGSYGGLNLGDEAILRAMICELRRALPVEITVFSRDAADTLARHPAECAVPVRELSRREVASEIQRLDLLILGGGGILYDTDASTYLRELQVADELGVPAMVYAVGAGPLADPAAQRLVQRCLERVAAVTVREREAQRVLEQAPRPDGGVGYPGLYLRPDLVGTADGLAKQPYIRESRRIRAVFTVTEQHVRAAVPGAHPAPDFADSAGVGCWHSIDLHPSTGGDNYLDLDTRPFLIPLGALLPIRVENILPACKNLGVTHITNGCFREHAVEWTIGEIVGLLAAHCLHRKLKPHEVRANPDHLSQFQRLLRTQGILSAWPRLSDRARQRPRSGH